MVDGAVVVTPSPRRWHQTVARRLANVLEQANAERYSVDTAVDRRLRDVPLLNRRPDIVVYDSSLPDDEVLRPHHCVLAIEIMSPGSVTVDRVHKPAEYAAGGIEHFWRAEIAENTRGLTVFRFRLDPEAKVYTAVGEDTGKLVTTEPFDVSISLDDLR